MSTGAQPGLFRIAYIVGGFPALSETFVVKQIAGMAARGHEVDIYTTCEEKVSRVPKEVERHGLMQKVVPLAAAPSRVIAALRILGLLFRIGRRSPAVVKGVAGEVRRNGFAGSVRLLYAALTLIARGTPRYDVVHAQFGHYGLLALQLKRIGAIDGAVIASFRGYDVGKYLPVHAAAFAELFRTGALFLPVSRSLADGLIRAGCDPSKVCVHHSGISCRDLRYRDPRPSGVAVHVVTVARLVEKKGLAYAIRAAARVLAAGRNISYTIIGEGPLRGELEQLIDRLNVGTQVRLVGAKPHDATLRMIEAADIMMAPSITAADGDAEGIPNVLKEAMALGLPVLATCHGGTPELVEDGVSGFLVPEGSDDALADKLLCLVDRPALWAAMGRAGRAKVEAEFDIEPLNLELEGLYASVVEKQRPEVNKKSLGAGRTPDRGATEQYAHVR